MAVATSPGTGATPITMMTLCVMTFGILILNVMVMTHSIKTLTITTVCVMTLGIILLNVVTT
jgi:hypothetical protein